MTREQQDDLSLRLAILSEALQGIEYFLSLSGSDSEFATIGSMMNVIIEYNKHTHKQLNKLEIRAG